MKKILLLAMFLGLTGCGDNNQSDTTQSNSQANILQKAEATPAVANYSLAASPRAMSAVAPLAGWSITQSFVEGASTLINAVKDTKVSAALVTPNAKQVAEVLRGGAAGVALNIAVDQLLDAVDWVMDPENNQIRYKVINYDQQYRYSNNEVLEYTGIQYVYTIAEAESAFKQFFSKLNRNYVFVGCNFNPNVNSGIDCTWGYPNEKPDRVVPFAPSKNPNYGEKTLPLETIAEQVISNADADSLDAQVATNIAAQNILNDVELAKPVVQELENNAKNNCPSGIIKNGSCWVCEKELYYPMSRATRDAKTATRGKSCKDVTDTMIKSANATLFRNLINARIQENACWSPPDPNHAIALVDAQNALRLCEN